MFTHLEVKYSFSRMIVYYYRLKYAYFQKFSVKQNSGPSAVRILFEKFNMNVYLMSEGR